MKCFLCVLVHILSILLHVGHCFFHHDSKIFIDIVSNTVKSGPCTLVTLHLNPFEFNMEETCTYNLLLILIKPPFNPTNILLIPLRYSLCKNTSLQNKMKDGSQLEEKMCSYTVKVEISVQNVWSELFIEIIRKL